MAAEVGGEKCQFRGEQQQEVETLAQFLIALYPVTKEYVHSAVASVWQPEAWALVKDNDWAQVFAYIEDDLSEKKLDADAGIAAASGARAEPGYYVTCSSCFHKCQFFDKWKDKLVRCHKCRSGFEAKEELPGGATGGPRGITPASPLSEDHLRGNGGIRTDSPRNLDLPGKVQGLPSNANPQSTDFPTSSARGASELPISRGDELPTVEQNTGIFPGGSQQGGGRVVFDPQKQESSNELERKPRFSKDSPLRTPETSRKSFGSPFGGQLAGLITPPSLGRPPSPGQKLPEAPSRARLNLGSALHEEPQSCLRSNYDQPQINGVTEESEEAADPLLDLRARIRKDGRERQELDRRGGAQRAGREPPWSRKDGLGSQNRGSALPAQAQKRPFASLTPSREGSSLGGNPDDDHMGDRKVDSPGRQRKLRKVGHNKWGGESSSAGLEEHTANGGVDLEDPEQGGQETSLLDSKPRASKREALQRIVEAKGGELLARGVAHTERQTPTSRNGGFSPPGGRAAGPASPPSEERSAGRGERVVSDDISNGREKVPIPCVNAFTEDELPKKFRYMTQSVPYCDARGMAPGPFSRLVDCDQCPCEGDCLDRRIACRCSRITGGEYAYNKEGRLDDDFLRSELQRLKEPEWVKCQGVCPKQLRLVDPSHRNKRDQIPPCEEHVRKRFIKECSLKCGCDMRCGNRVLQRGITQRLQVFWTPTGKGWGVRCQDDLPAGGFVCEYVGEIMTGDELDERNRARRNAPHFYPVELDADYVVEEYATDATGLSLDGTQAGNVARYINHRCEDASLLSIPVEIEGPDHNHYHVALFTTRYVPAMEELTWDYGIDFEDRNHPIKAFACTCGSRQCRDTQKTTGPGPPRNGKH